MKGNHRKMYSRCRSTTQRYCVFASLLGIHPSILSALPIRHSFIPYQAGGGYCQVRSSVHELLEHDTLIIVP